jgi:hypothetical protein
LWVALALVVLIIGSMLPWWQTFLGSRWGLDTYGIWTIWAGAVGMTGALSMRRNLYELLPLVAGIAAFAIVLWVAFQGVGECAPAADGSVPCRPGIGLVITGAAAINTVVLMARYHLREKQQA